MKIIINSVMQDMPYEDICGILGFIPDVQFVKITNRGKIGFTCGTPEEVRALFCSALNNGMQLSGDAQKIARRNGWRQFA